MCNHECKKCLGADQALPIFARALGMFLETSLYILTKSLQQFDFNFSSVLFMYFFHFVTFSASNKSFSFVNFLRRLGGRSQKKIKERNVT